MTPSRPRRMMPAFAINGERLLRRLDHFASIGGGKDGGVNRQALTVLDRKARSALAQIALGRGFEVFQDDIANLFIRRAGRDNTAPPFLIGSHMDTQPTGGRFDGALGTLAALEVLEALEDGGVETAIPVEVVAWTNEEGCRFSPGSMGSRAFVEGAIPVEVLAATGTDGALLAQELAATLRALPDARPRPLGIAISGYLELHIEQGPDLEREEIPIGVVSAVQGTRWLQVHLTGEAAHAGTTPFAERRDPMMAATVGLAELYATIMPADSDARLTVGRMSVIPGSINAIPAEAVFTVDIRHPDDDRLDQIEDAIRAAMSHAANASGCSLAIDRITDMPPTAFSESLLGCVERAADAMGVRHRRIISRAFHDALFVNQLAPSAMIFVPCRKGISHNAAEFVEPAFSILGAEVLLHATLDAVSLENTSEWVLEAKDMEAISDR